MKLDQLKALEARATKKPWSIDSVLRTVYGKCFTGEWKVIVDKVRGGNVQEADANVALIAAMRNHIVALIEIAEAAQDEVYKEDRSLYIFQIQQALAKLESLS